MDSRQVTLLTRGYLLGWLTFEYPNPLSYLRETLILREIEKDLYKDIVALRGQVDAALVSSVVAHKRDACDVPYSAVQSFTELTLPYVHKQTKIDKSVGIEDKDYWVNFMAERKKAKLAELEKKKAE